MRSHAAASSMVVALAFAASLTQGCATAATSHDDEMTGELVVQLVQPGPRGQIFHLANATFDITAADGSTTTVDGSSSDAQINVSLPPGIATIFLRDGWTLEQSDDGGATFKPV